MEQPRGLQHEFDRLAVVREQVITRDAAVVGVQSPLGELRELDPNLLDREQRQPDIVDRGLPPVGFGSVRIGEEWAVQRRRPIVRVLSSCEPLLSRARITSHCAFPIDRADCTR